MKERPILFSSPMIRALLSGRKTQTRRVVAMRQFKRTDTPGYDFIFRDRRGLWNDYRHADLVRSKWNTVGAPGDRLWVRETWSLDFGTGFSNGSTVENRYEIRYRADEARRGLVCEGPVGSDPYLKLYDSQRGKWRPSIHMPRWASRITLEVTAVRVERLQDISPAAVRAEGVDCTEHDGPGLLCTSPCAALLGGFAQLWDSLNGKRAPWASNPWVWVVEFRRVEAAS